MRQRPSPGARLSGEPNDHRDGRGIVKAELPERLEKLIEYCPTSGCWLWIGSLTAAGYGRIFVNGKSEYVHRVMYGDIPEGLEIDHLCRVPSCCNPAHLEAVTHQDNVRRSPHCGDDEFCKRGHAWTSKTTYLYPEGGRQCRVCTKERRRRIRAAARADMGQA